MDIQSYLNEIRSLYASGQTTELSFRPALVELFKAIDRSLTVINEPKHISDVGAPDLVFYRGISLSVGARPRTSVRTFASSLPTITAKPRKIDTKRAYLT